MRCGGLGTVGGSTISARFGWLDAHDDRASSISASRGEQQEALMSRVEESEEAGEHGEEGEMMKGKGVLWLAECIISHEVPSSSTSKLRHRSMDACLDWHGKISAEGKGSVIWGPSTSMKPPS